MRRLTIPALFIVIIAAVYSAPLLRGQATGPQMPAPPVTTVPGVVQPPAAGAPSQQAVAVTTVPSPAAPQNPVDQVMWAAACVYVIEYIKKSKRFPFITDASEARAKAIFSFAVAACTAAGIHLVVNGSPFSAHGASVTFTGLSFDAFKDIGFQWLSQQIGYDLLVKRLKQGATV